MNTLITAGLIAIVAYAVAAFAGLVTFAPVDMLISLFRAIVGLG